MSLREVRAFAPATVGNVACGFDLFGLALESPGDEVVARPAERPGVRLVTLTGDDGRLPWEADRNTASVAAADLLRRRGRGEGVELELHKGLPLGSGLGSSAASAVAAVVAVDALFGLQSPSEELLQAAAEGERVACGSAHLDNAAPSLLGGLVMVTSGEPPRPVRMPVPAELCCAMARPHVEVPTQKAREVLGSTVSLSAATRQWTNAATLVAGLFLEDWELLALAIEDVVAEPKRAPLVPGFRAAQAAALAEGALGCSISGAGPAIFALCRGRRVAEAVQDAMAGAIEEAGVGVDAFVSGVGGGASVLESKS